MRGWWEATKVMDKTEASQMRKGRGCCIDLSTESEGAPPTGQGGIAAIKKAMESPPFRVLF